MAQQGPERKRPAHGKAGRQSAKARPSTKRNTANREDLSRQQKMLTMMNQLHEQEDFDDDLFSAVSADHEKDDEEEKSLKLMMEELTEEAVHNTKTNEFTLDQDLTPRYIVELDEGEEETEVRSFHPELLIPIILAVIALFGGIYALQNKPQKEPAALTPQESPDITLIEETPAPEATEDPEDTLMKNLSRSITEIIHESEGTWSIYLKNLDTSRSFVINDTQMSSASLIKLFTAGRYLEMVENGELYETADTAYCLSAMISWSDNDAWEAIETYIGYGDYNGGLMSVTDFAKRHGYTLSGREIGTESIFDPDADNLTSAAEIGRVLEEIYNGTYVSANASQRLYDLLYNQGITYKIPAGLPEGFESASKSGELPGIENDAAIIKGPDTAYILVVMSNGIYDSEAAAERIAEISNLCALSLNPSAQ
ncbi:MAG: serine hydrolase [Erysipelotrichaceae bacterium]|nr:serine hydrolase [Erysipelotrichaceae bacterium]